MKVIKPPRLSTGNTIGIVASSLPVSPRHKKQYEKGKKLITDMGFKIKEGNTTKKVRWWMTGTPKEVADDINSMFADKNVKAIMAHTGGYSAISVLEHLDYELITMTPKPFIGMSDMTVYHLAIFSQTGMVGFHMDDVTFGLSDPKFDKNMFINFLMKNEPAGMIKPLSEWEEWKEGQVRGHLIGGNLHLMCNLLGTPYFPPKEAFEKAILFWEEVGEPLHSIVRSLYQLKYAGVLDKISGMLIGKITYLKPMREKEIVVPDAKEIILETVKEYDFPIMANLDFGHFTVNIPMPVGIKVEFDSSKKELSFLEGAVR